MFCFSFSAEQILEKNHLRYEIESIIQGQRNVWMCIKCVCMAPKAPGACLSMHDRSRGMHACLQIDSQYIHQMKAFDLLIHCYFIHCVIFLNYLFGRSKKLISKIGYAFDVIENLVWTKQEILACCVFPSPLNKYLRKTT